MHLFKLSVLDSNLHKVLLEALTNALHKGRNTHMRTKSFNSEDYSNLRWKENSVSRTRAKALCWHLIWY